MPRPRRSRRGACSDRPARVPSGGRTPACVHRTRNERWPRWRPGRQPIPGEGSPRRRRRGRRGAASARSAARARTGARAHRYARRPRQAGPARPQRYPAPAGRRRRGRDSSIPGTARPPWPTPASRRRALRRWRGLRRDRASCRARACRRRRSRDAGSGAARRRRAHGARAGRRRLRSRGRRTARAAGAPRRSPRRPRALRA